MNNVYGRPGPNSIWTTTALGDVYVFDPAIAEVKHRHGYVIYVNRKESYMLLQSYYVFMYYVILLLRNVNYLKTDTYKKWTLLVKIYHLRAYYKMVLDMVVL